MSVIAVFDPMGFIVRFQKDSTPPPYLNRRDQYRMLGLVSMLLLIVLSIDFTRKPENWRWFFSLGEQPIQMQLKELSLDDLDFRVQEPATGSLPADTFIALADARPTIDLNELGLDIKRIPPELLEEVQDKRVGLLRSEQAAMDRVLKRVQAITQKELNAAAETDVGFRVVFSESEKYRGQLIKVEGTLFRLQEFEFGDPASKEDNLWQAWFFSSDSGNNPWVVFMTEKPAEVAAGENILREMSVAGYFFKNYGYATNEGLHIAPMLIARTITIKPLPPTVDSTTENLSLYVFIFLLSIGLMFGAMVWWFVRSDRKFDQSHLAEIAHDRHNISTEFIASLEGKEAQDPRLLVLPKAEDPE